MKADDDAIEAVSMPAPRATVSAALLWGAAGVTAFSLTLPATKLAVESIDGLVVGLGRAVIAAVCAAAVLVIRRVPVPRRTLWPRFALVVLGVVVGFPLLTALALRSVDSSHGAIVVGLLPGATAVMGVLRARERPPLAFWVSSVVGLAAIIVFCTVSGFGRVHLADVLLLIAVMLAALGYAEGALLSREVGAWQTICWALVLSAPLLGPIVAVRLLSVGWAPSAASLAGFAYVSVFSMFLGFLAWYQALALGGIAKIGQLQLAQPIMTLAWGSVLLGETITPLHGMMAVIVLLSVGATLTLRIRQAPARVG